MVSPKCKYPKVPGGCKMGSQKRLILKIALFLIIAVVVFCVKLTPLSAASPDPLLPEPCLWTKTDTTDIPLEEQHKRALLEYTLARFSSSGKRAAAPPVIETDKISRIVFISVSDGQSPAVVAHGKGEGLSEALDSAIMALKENNGIKFFKPEWVKIDVVRDIQIRSMAPVT